MILHHDSSVSADLSRPFCHRSVLYSVFLRRDTLRTVSNVTGLFWHRGRMSLVWATEEDNDLQGPPTLEEELRRDARYAYWLKLADTVLNNARQEQERIKAGIRPHVERYLRITGRSK
jgi:hypothetical protein